MDALSRQLMQPDLVDEFVTAFRQEWRRLADQAKSQAAAHQRERATLDRKIANLVESISDGRSSPAIMAKLASLRPRRPGWAICLLLPQRLNRHCIPASRSSTRRRFVTSLPHLQPMTTPRRWKPPAR